MVAILLTAAFLRIYRLGEIPPGLIPDEAIRGYDAYALGRTGADSYGAAWPLFTRSYDDYVPALYGYLSGLLLAVLDLSVFSFRLSSAFLGLLAVALSYRLIRRTFGEQAGLVGAFLLAISPWHILPSRTGLEFSLFFLGPTLTITLAYRGLTRPRTLMMAGLAGGLSLYGYSPIKAFLPVLLAGFVLFYWPELKRQRWAALVGLLLFLLPAIPVYTFSFTPAGMSRLAEVYQGSDSGGMSVMDLIRNYLSYFAPDFLFGMNYTGVEGRTPVAISRLEGMGLLYWAELPLILLGLVQLRHKRAWFMFYWLATAPVGINLHEASPMPYLFLTALPAPQALAGAGWAWLISGRSVVRLRWCLAILLSGGILLQAGRMVDDLFYRYPIYGAEAWMYGRGASIQAMTAVQSQFDEVILAAEDLTSTVYLLFYTRYDPTRRQAELAQQPDQTWQKVADYRIGDARDYLQQPGCHLLLTSVADAADLRQQLPHLITLQRFDLPDGTPKYGLYAAPIPAGRIVEKGAVFDDKIALQGFAPVSALRPGRAICLIMQWQAVAPVTTDYTVFVHLIGPEGRLWAQHDSPPAYGGRPTTGWQAGEIIQEAHIMTTPPDMPSGRYRLVAGLYDSATGQRLPVTGRDNDRVILMELSLP